MSNVVFKDSSQNGKNILHAFKHGAWETYSTPKRLALGELCVIVPSTKTNKDREGMWCLVGKVSAFVSIEGNTIPWEGIGVNEVDGDYNLKIQLSDCELVKFSDLSEEVLLACKKQSCSPFIYFDKADEIQMLDIDLFLGVEDIGYQSFGHHFSFNKTTRELKVTISYISIPMVSDITKVTEPVSSISEWMKTDSYQDFICGPQAHACEVLHSKLIG